MNWDALLLAKIRDVARNDVLDVIMPIITHLGDGGFIWIAIGLCLLATKRYRYVGILTLCALAASGIVGNIFLKNLVERPRPFMELDLVILISKPEGFSFPSGHTFASFAAAGVIAHYLRRWTWPVFILASVIGFSRVYVGVHYPTDVLVGGIFGFLVAKLVMLAGVAVSRHGLIKMSASNP